MTADQEAVALAHRLFDLARAGSSDLLGYVDARAPVNLTDAAGNSLLMLAAYHGHAVLTAELAGRGADPNSVNPARPRCSSAGRLLAALEGQ